MRTLRALFWLSVAAPLTFIVGLGVVTHFLLRTALSDAAAYAVAAAIAAPFILAFSAIVFRTFRQLQARLEQQTDELRSLYEAGMSLNSELSLDPVLNKLVELAMRLTGARYGAMSVIGKAGGIERFLTPGISEQERRRIGDPPQGKGLLGVILREGASLRVEDMSADPRHVGFPPNHPPMKSLLGVPIVIRDRVIGNLYLTDKVDGQPFNDRDEEVVKLLGAQAAVAIENAQLYERVQSLVRLEERDRIGMDLHDGIIQSIYAVSLHLESAAEQAEESPLAVRRDLDKAIDDLNKVIRDIRNYIFDLRPQVSRVGDLRQALTELVQEVKVNSLIEAELEVEGEVEDELVRLDEDQALALFHIVQEALNNVVKHSSASAVRVKLGLERGALHLTVVDNGVGFDLEAQRDRQRHGLRNMMDRARSLGVELRIESAEGRGTQIALELPLAEARTK